MPVSLNDRLVVIVAVASSALFDLAASTSIPQQARPETAAL
jgi:hypothetical protein